jgi:hypothetical protein
VTVTEGAQVVVAGKERLPALRQIFLRVDRPLMRARDEGRYGFGEFFLVALCIGDET